VVVHHIVSIPIAAADGRPVLVVFLEAGLNQHALARHTALRMTGVREVSFSRHTNAIMYVIGNLKARSGPSLGT
jgi:hypothetical protein